jgi:hypothetical protein
MRGLTRVVSRLVGVALPVLGVMGAGAAQAGEEVRCARQYALEEHLILEWAALGGDPHAQFAIGQCAFPQDGAALGQDEKIYALQWLVLATCDSAETPSNIERDRLTRKLRDNADISFRRFGGVTEDERWTRREKRFKEYRADKLNQLRARHDRLQSQATDLDRERARDALVERFARMGGLGLMRLASLAECREFGATKPLAAAIWKAAAESWAAPDSEPVYGRSLRRDWSIAKEAASRASALSRAERREAERWHGALSRTTPARLAALEDAAALSRLGETAPSAHARSQGSVAQSTTLAVQYALEALGWIEFVNGPDNDYGPTTSEAARRAQAHYGREQTRWLSPAEARQLVCDAALEANDPVSNYHLALMYAEGAGFAQDWARALHAIERAQTYLIAALAEPAELPAWKRDAYARYRKTLADAKAAIAAEHRAAAATASSAEPPAALCR